MSNKTIYLAGPMTGIAEFNHPEFREVSAIMWQQGMTVLSPTDVDGGSVDKSWHFYMKGALKMLLDADAIALLPGWEKSKGARIELGLAESLGYEVFLIDRGPYGEDVILTSKARGGACR